MKDELHTERSLQEKIAEGVKRTGYPLQMQIGGVLSSAGWDANYCHYYVDPQELGYRELDIQATKIVKGVRINLSIECKHSCDKQWVFFAPAPSPTVRMAPKYLPYLDRSGGFIPPTLFANLWQGRSKSLALYMAVAKGDKFDTNQTEFRAAAYGCTNAILHEIARLGKQDVRNVFLPFIVFDSGMFLYRWDWPEPREVSFVLYSHYGPIDVARVPREVVDPAVPQAFQTASRTHGADWIVEVLQPAQLPTRLSAIEKAVQSWDEKTLSLWGRDALSLQEILAEIFKGVIPPPKS
jgi:hypothetical protein